VSRNAVGDTVRDPTRNEDVSNDVDDTVGSRRVCNFHLDTIDGNRGERYQMSSLFNAEISEPSDKLAGNTAPLKTW